MFHLFRLAIGQLFLATIACPVVLFAQSDKSNDVFADLLRSEFGGISEQEISEIIDIRNRLGGGTAIELNWPTRSEKPGKAAPFELPIFNADTPEHLVVDTESERIFLKMLDQCSTGLKKPGSIVANDYRKIARKLDELASDLEDLELYVTADEIRSQASKLRNQARTASQSKLIR